MRHLPSTPFLCIAAALVTGLPVFSGSAAVAATVEVVASPSASGVITDINPGMISVRVEKGGAPLHYAPSSTTTYVDEAGHTVTVESIKAGTPVEIFYTRVGDVLAASRVVVHQPVVIVHHEREHEHGVHHTRRAPEVIEKKTTTTTTTTTTTNVSR